LVMAKVVLSRLTRHVQRLEEGVHGGEAEIADVPSCIARQRDPGHELLVAQAPGKAALSCAVAARRLLLGGSRELRAGEQAAPGLRRPEVLVGPLRGDVLEELQRAGRAAPSSIVVTSASRYSRSASAVRRAAHAPHLDTGWPRSCRALRRRRRFGAVVATGTAALGAT
jgi:hypothetical protein